MYVVISNATFPPERLMIHVRCPICRDFFMTDAYQRTYIQGAPIKSIPLQSLADHQRFKLIL